MLLTLLLLKWKLFWCIRFLKRIKMNLFKVVVLLIHTTKDFLNKQWIKKVTIWIFHKIFLVAFRYSGNQRSSHDGLPKLPYRPYCLTTNHNSSHHLSDYYVCVIYGWKIKTLGIAISNLYWKKRRKARYHLITSAERHLSNKNLILILMLVLYY